MRLHPFSGPTKVLQGVGVLFAVLSLLVASPRTASAAIIYKSGTLSQNEIWTADNTYIINGTVTVPNGLTLTIQAGTVVKFAVASSRLSLVVSGNLATQGTAASPVVFTSVNDNTVGGPPTGSGVPNSSDWGCLNFANANGSYQVEYAVVRYGGYQCSGLIQSAGSLTLRHVTVEKASGAAIYVTGSQTTVADSVIATAGGYAIDSRSTTTTLQNNTVTNASSGIYANGSVVTVSNNRISQGGGTGIVLANAPNATLTGNTVTNMGQGLQMSNSSPTITNNIVKDNGGYPFYQFDNAFPTYSGNTVTGNGVQAIAVGGTIGTGTWVNVQGLGLPYVVVGSIAVPQGTTLTIPAGTVVKFAVASSRLSLVVSGNLATQGTAASPVVFTSVNDNTVGGPPTGSGVPNSSDWGCLNFANANGSYQVEYAVVRYGGYQCSGLIQSAGSLTLRHVTVEKASGAAIYVTGSQTTVADSVIATAGGYAIDSRSTTTTLQNNTVTNASSGIYANGSVVTVSNNRISQGGGTGIVLANAPNATLTGNTVTNMGQGLQMSNSSPTITNNIVKDNGGYPFYQFDNAFPTYSGNTVTGNGVQAIAVGGTIGTGTWVNVQGLGLPYVVVGSIAVPQGTTLTIPAGTVVKFAVASSRLSLVVSGNLATQGTAASPVVFTSVNDNTVGGPPTGSGVPNSSDWGCLNFANANGSYQVEYAVVRYGGYQCSGLIQSAGSLTLRHVLVEKSYGDGLYATYSGRPLTVEGCTFRANGGSGIRVQQ